MKKYTRLLTIAGSDSGGGAGIQADLKTFAACGCYGMSAITALTAQNSVGVDAVLPIPVTMLEAQLVAVFEDIGVDAVKIGMLHSAGSVECVADILARYECPRVVLDPVMVATSGDRLIEEGGVEAICRLLMPKVGLITPNIPEAELLLGEKIADGADFERACRSLAEKYRVGVLVKGGHLLGDLLRDVLLEAPGQEFSSYDFSRCPTRNTHGTGCTLSSAIAAFWGKGMGLKEAVAEAENYLHAAIVAGADYSLGAGHGPVHHFYACWRS